MTKVRIVMIVDPRRPAENNEYPLSLRVSHKTKYAYISLGIRAGRDRFDEKTQRLTGKNTRETNAFIEAKLLTAQQTVNALNLAGELPRMTADEIKKRIEAAYGGSMNETKHTSFTDFFESQIATKKATQTKMLYSQTLKTILAFSKNRKLSFDDITCEWLTKYDDFLSTSSPSQNARNIHLRNIRAVFNAAIDDEITTHYPFRKFKIKAEETRKRAISVTALRQIYHMRIDDSQTAYFRDMFMLSFFLIGINTVDLYNIKSVDDEGRITYKRAKTGRKYDIKIEPEAMAIINRYKGKNTLVDIADRYQTDYRHFTEKSSMHLKKLHPDISMYWARHTWATIAAQIDTPIETISAALGHSMGSRVTAIYIDFNRNKIDAANRKVIDYLLYGPADTLPKTNKLF